MCITMVLFMAPKVLFHHNFYCTCINLLLCLNGHNFTEKEASFLVIKLGEFCCTEQKLFCWTYTKDRFPLGLEYC